MSTKSNTYVGPPEHFATYVREVVDDLLRSTPMPPPEPGGVVSLTIKLEFEGKRVEASGFAISIADSDGPDGPQVLNPTSLPPATGPSTLPVPPEDVPPASNAEPERGD